MNDIEKSHAAYARFMAWRKVQNRTADEQAAMSAALKEVDEAYLYGIDAAESSGSAEIDASPLFAAGRADRDDGKETESRYRCPDGHTWGVP